MYNYLQPLVAGLFAILLGQDTFSWTKPLSAVLIFVGVYFVTTSKSREDVEREQNSVILDGDLNELELSPLKERVRN